MASSTPVIGPVIGMVVITHGPLAEALIAALEHVVGPQPQLAAVAVRPDEDLDDARQRIVAAAAAVDRGRGCVLLTDMFGGTPSNLAISVMGHGQIEVLAGVNLPMLVTLAGIRGSMALHQAVLAAQDAGRRYIRVASAVLAEPRRAQP